MSPEGHFWISWTVQLAIAVGTLGAVIVALFGGWLRDKLAPPRLRLTLVDPRGVRSPATLKLPDGTSRETERTRWYHLRVENDRRWAPATDVQVFLLRVEEPNAAGDYRITWTGEVPLRWRHQEFYPLVRKIGYGADCDLCSVVEEKWVELHPLIAPRALKHQWREPFKIILSLEARSLERDSNSLRVHIAWDGRWSDDATVMAHHLTVAVLADSAGSRH